MRRIFTIIAIICVVAITAHAGDSNLLFDAIEGGKPTTEIKAVLDAHPELVNSRNGGGETPLLSAIKDGNIEVVKILLAAKADLTAKSTFGDAAIDCVAWVQDAKAIDQLMTLILNGQPSEINARGCLDETPLMYAADRGNLHFAEALLKSGADKTLKNADGKTALEIAQQRAASAGTDDPANAIVTLLRQ